MLSRKVTALEAAFNFKQYHKHEEFLKLSDSPGKLIRQRGSITLTPFHWKTVSFPLTLPPLGFILD